MHTGGLFIISPEPATVEIIVISMHPTGWQMTDRTVSLIPPRVRVFSSMMIG